MWKVPGSDSLLDDVTLQQLATLVSCRVLYYVTTSFSSIVWHSRGDSNCFTVTVIVFLIGAVFLLPKIDEKLHLLRTSSKTAGRTQLEK
jgi:hypothetical protein